jgi:drug/metabolite transporter (DMT)-like permease
VGTYAYVNPIVAVIVGALLGGETIGRRTIIGAALILVSVVAITTMKAKSSAVQKRDSTLQEQTAAD